MILASHGLIASSISGVDADWLAYYNRVIAAGGSLTTTEQNATKTLVADLKSNSLWTPMLAIYPMVGASAAACAQNLKSASFTGTVTSGFTFASTGVTGNGASTFMDTGFIPSANLTLTSGAYSIYSRTNIDQVSIDMAVLSSSGPIHQIITRLSGDQHFAYVNTNGNYTATNTNSFGHYILNRNSSTNTKGFRNGIQVYNVAQTAGLPTESIYIGARNQSGSAIIPTSRQYAFASCGDGLTDTQAGNFYTAVQAFQTTLSRNV